MIKKCKIIDLPIIADQRGNLSIAEESQAIPFPMKRIYYLYDVPTGAARGGHAHKEMESVIIALSGSFDVIVDDGKKKEKFFMNRPHYGIYVPPFTWREIVNFSSNSIALAIVSTPYDEADYIREYESFKDQIKNYG
ncbi:FdtA/QdtA family cupin domain-containing protein [Patescibacteria group bacterium]|nr:FdtA/QdtA family cupin domain-containing protein [Patescibacteria group bacterium]MBU1963969.1 FdtA/QdtA family cupin domain-containing protein [Patescibacteria group bacterium]